MHPPNALPTIASLQATHHNLVPIDFNIRRLQKTEYALWTTEKLLQPHWVDYPTYSLVGPRKPGLPRPDLCYSYKYVPTLTATGIPRRHELPPPTHAHLNAATSNAPHTNESSDEILHPSSPSPTPLHSPLQPTQDLLLDLPEPPPIPPLPVNSPSELSTHADETTQQAYRKALQTILNNIEITDQAVCFSDPRFASQTPPTLPNHNPPLINLDTQILIPVRQLYNLLAMNNLQQNNNPSLEPDQTPPQKRRRIN